METNNNTPCSLSVFVRIDFMDDDFVVCKCRQKRLALPAQDDIDNIVAKIRQAYEESGHQVKSAMAVHETAYEQYMANNANHNMYKTSYSVEKNLITSQPVKTPLGIPGMDFLRVKTPRGTLIAYPSIDSNNPGIFIDLTQDDVSYALNLACVECQTGENDSDSEIVSHVWGDGRQEDATHDVRHVNIDSYFTENGQ